MSASEPHSDPMRQVLLLPFLQVRKLRFRGVQGLVGVPQLEAEEPIAGPGRWSSESSPVPRDTALGTESYHLSRFEAEEREPLSGMTVNSSPFQFMSDPILHQEKLLKRAVLMLEKGAEQEDEVLRMLSLRALGNMALGAPRKVRGGQGRDWGWGAHAGLFWAARRGLKALCPAGEAVPEALTGEVPVVPSGARREHQRDL